MSPISTLEAIAAVYLDRHSLNLATTRQDLKLCGFSQADIDRHAARAAEFAAKRLKTRQTGKAA